MSDRPLLVTTTGEPIQPARLHYAVRDRKRLEACFRKLRCMAFEKKRKGWVWHYDDEARSLEFERPWNEVCEGGAIVLGTFYLTGANSAELFVRSIERALAAITFFDEHLSRSVTRVTDMDVANRLFSADELDLTPEALFRAAEGDLRQQAKDREELLADPKKMMADFHRQYDAGQPDHLPELERLPTHFYEDGIDVLTAVMRMRQALAMEHWQGNHDLTLTDLIKRSVTQSMTHESKLAQVAGATAARTGARPRRTDIDWDFGPDVPTRDSLESLDISNPGGLSMAVEHFIDAMEQDEFRTWEAVIREEQDLPMMPVLLDLKARLMHFGEPEDGGPIYYVNEIERPTEPWYEILRRIAPRLLVEPLRAADTQDDMAADGWQQIAAWLERRGRGLSLPEGARQPLDVIPDDLRHRLWIQACCEPLCGLGQLPEMTLVDQEEHWRIDEFIGLMRRHRDSVEFLSVTAGGLLKLCELPERDRPIFITMVCERLGLSGPDEPLAPKLGCAVEPADEIKDPIERLAEEAIRQAILHPEPGVSRTAMGYFAGGAPDDGTVAPLIIQALQAMEDERNRTYAYLCLRHLAQTDEVSREILRELRTRKSASDDREAYHHAVAWSLMAASPSFLAANEQKILAALPECDPMLREDIEGLVADSKLDSDERWSEFLNFTAADEADEVLADFYPWLGFVHRVERLVGDMGDDERPACWVMEMLPLTINDAQYSTSNELIAVSLAGVLRLSEAIEYLVPLLHDDDPEMVEQAVLALSRIGTDQVIEALDRTFPVGERHFRLQAAAVLQRIHTDRSVRTLQTWLRFLRNEAVQCRIRQALLEQFATSEVDRAREWLIDAKPTCDEVRGLRRALVACAIVAGRDFAELDEWLGLVRDDLASEPCPGEWSDEDWDEFDFEEEDWDDYEMEDADMEDDAWDGGSTFSGTAMFPPSHAGRAPGILSAHPDEDSAYAPKTHTNRGKKVGRNAPCPCGSGKKYKKCCLRKG